jgi:hypothetical protein
MLITLTAGNINNNQLVNISEFPVRSIIGWDEKC